MLPRCAPRCLALVLLLAAATRAAAAQALAPLPFRRGEIAVHVRVDRFPDFTARVSADSAAFTGDSLGAASGYAVARSAEIQTGIGLLDSRMRRTLDADGYPQIRFDLERVTPDPAPGGSSGAPTRPDTVAVTLAGFFTIRGVTRDVTIPGTVVLSPGALVVAATFPLDVRGYGIAPPTAFFGIVRAEPVVEISVRLEFGR
jgi:polyisoprenoid-binding protein YceI